MHLVDCQPSIDMNGKPKPMCDRPILKRWADGFISSGLAAEVVGTPAIGGDGKIKRLPDDLSC